MPDTSEITSNAIEAARKAAPGTEQLKSPAAIATAGAALIALPLAAQKIADMTGGKAAKVGQQAKSRVTKKAKDVAGDLADDTIKEKMPKGLGGLVKGGSDLRSLFSGNGDSGSDEDGEATEAYGSGRRMPMQQAVDVAVPITEAYNLWTEFEEWPSFMHRVDSAQQIDDATVAFSAKVWGITKNFQAEILEQRPDERIVWDVSEGLKHSGVVTFHKLAPRLTRIEITVDVKPDSLLEKAGRGMRFTKRAVRGDLHRFKAYAEMEEESEEGGWRGTIEDGEVKRKTDRKSSGSKGKSRSRQSKNGSDPSQKSSRSADSHS
jgi:uncharacterized membrane protein